MRIHPPTGQRGALAAFILCLMLALGYAQAATPVSGTISGQTWTASNSPYVVTGDITVESLTIQPGVTVEFAGHYGFSVTNRLTAIGTADAPILFTPRNASVGWKGISFDLAGAASEMAFCTVQWASQSGIRIRSSQPIIRDCTVSNNASSGHPAQGGGIWTDSPLTLTRCVIEFNLLGNTPYAAGAGIYASAPLTLQSCLITDNHITVSAMGLAETSATGAGIFSTANLVINNSKVIANTARSLTLLGSATGGGIFAARLFATNTLVCQNRTNGDGHSNGAGIAAPSGQLVNCTVADNTATGRITVVAGGLSGGKDSSGAVTVLNSIFWVNTPYEIDGEVAVSYSNVTGGFAGTGNMSQNPLFADLRDFQITPDSPCVDAGDPLSSYNDACFPPSFGTARNDMGASGGPLACAFDFDSAPTIIVQPQSQRVCLGNAVELSVLAHSISPLRYQWHFNGAILPGQSNATLSLAAFQPEMAGSYTVNIANNAGSIISEMAHLTVIDGCLDIQMYAGLTISGILGATYVISYTTDVAPPQTWTPQATNTLNGSNWFFVDRDSIASVRRFYRAVRK